MVRSQEDIVRSEVTKIKGLYEAELSDARRLLDQMAKDKARIQLELGKLKADLDELNTKYVAYSYIPTSMLYTVYIYIYDISMCTRVPQRSVPGSTAYRPVFFKYLQLGLLWTRGYLKQKWEKCFQY